jgi:hypothetical protein
MSQNDSFTPHQHQTVTLRLGEDESRRAIWCDLWLCSPTAHKPNPLHPRLTTLRLKPTNLSLPGRHNATPLTASRSVLRLYLPTRWRRQPPAPKTDNIAPQTNKLVTLAEPQRGPQNSGLL